MKIAIFGDSFAHTEEFNENRSWYESVKAHGYDVNNFARSGSSLWYSYDQFIKHNSEYDKCIFLVTNWGRYHVPQMFQPFWAGISQVEESLRNDRSLTHNQRRVLESLYNWTLYARNDEQEILFHSLMIKDIVNTKKDCLVIPCFNYDMSRISNFNMCSMFDIHAIDMIHYKIEFQDSNGIWKKKPLRQNGRELRACHMNDENNVIFAQKIINWIDNNQFKMSVNDFVTSSKSVEYYFELES